MRVLGGVHGALCWSSDATVRESSGATGALDVLARFRASPSTACPVAHPTDRVRSTIRIAVTASAPSGRWVSRARSIDSQARIAVRHSDANAAYRTSTGASRRDARRECPWASRDANGCVLPEAPRQPISSRRAAGLRLGRRSHGAAGATSAASWSRTVSSAFQADAHSHSAPAGGLRPPARAPGSVRRGSPRAGAGWTGRERQRCVLRQGHRSRRPEGAKSRSPVRNRPTSRAGSATSADIDKFAPC
jgi:hypothetical protein